MVKEVADQLALLTMIHATIDKMVEGLSDEEWTKKSGEGYNSVAAVIDHVLLVEEKFLSVYTGTISDVNTQTPFQSAPADLADIRSRWEASLGKAESTLSGLTESDLDAPAIKLGVGELNKRQLLAYMIAHTAHHRGQIPIIKKLNQGVK
ncbi:DinB family protein [Alicyclobacillus ferrooxydans]|uniref:Damage-inducible protein DinB n=1 Tax=Alicyclobacillus ferrooxydans TaxID=471514 RepID=A0A0P9EIS0_9BACL|nr:DinB family protein [Alicyclobacillus ferrooxydans]KPV42738.1 damage-inducible protein DinB [Alicyclobacillus ferrooxydans]